MPGYTEDSEPRAYDLDLENALETDRTEELEDNLDIELSDPTAVPGLAEGFSIDDGFESEDALAALTQDDEEEYVVHEPSADAGESNLRTREPWREETTITDGAHVLDEFGETTSS
ncbi:hypothetical protein [Mycetocola spongiae]|uniref:hypothetical protein n=1 Tax=Mycetocola spongiae TaxID=2859226 RepID=UPI001CF5BF9F|nr:hypothetical protein [Mycetocola spongiae]UCR89114.1 hypothetical protein KXZ72_14465 [Mycetocola spongiae]